MDLKLFFVLFAVLRNKEYHASAGYIFAKDSYSAAELLAKKYGTISIRSIDEVKIEEGTILYGERWHKI